MKLGKAIKLLRLLNGESQIEFADKLGIKKAYLSYPLNIVSVNDFLSPLWTKS